MLLEAGIDVIGQTSDAVGLIGDVSAEPDIAIVDIRMPPTHTDEGSLPPGRSAPSTHTSASSSSPSTSTRATPYDSSRTTPNGSATYSRNGCSRHHPARRPAPDRRRRHRHGPHHRVAPDRPTPPPRPPGLLNTRARSPSSSPKACPTGRSPPACSSANAPSRRTSPRSSRTRPHRLLRPPPTSPRRPHLPPNLTYAAFSFVCPTASTTRHLEQIRSPGHGDDHRPASDHKQTDRSRPHHVSPADRMRTATPSDAWT